ncbi:hypothetical protein ACIRRA_43225 [Nocardia sp. NPDC101769]|uniref:hypothetical protein n=1 Tax=Nocardia sp. NPDC101769 TaxID=3364333 RepID=UPI0037F97250
MTRGFSAQLQTVAGSHHISPIQQAHIIDYLDNLAADAPSVRALVGADLPYHRPSMVVTSNGRTAPAGTVAISESARCLWHALGAYAAGLHGFAPGIPTPALAIQDRWLEGNLDELLTFDIAFELPTAMRDQSIARSRQFAALMRESAIRPEFVLGERVPWGTESAEPHVSIFMLSAPRGMIPLLAHALDHVAADMAPIPAVGHHYGHNPHGAPEIYFAHSPVWQAGQDAIVTTFEPFRQGRVRPEGPFGEPLAAMLTGAVPAEPDRVQQLRATGYDEIGNRFNPHVTESAPNDPTHEVSLDRLPPPHLFRGTLTSLALYGMGPFGTCLTNFHRTEIRTHPGS